MKAAAEIPRQGLVGQMVVLSAPSGTGKTTVAQGLVDGVEGLKRSVSYTTRPRRAGEEEGVHYHFIRKDEFEAMAARGEFLEWAQIYGELYGTGAAATRRVLEQGMDLLLVIDVQGARWVRRRAPEALFVFLLPPSHEALLRRLRRRGTESTGTEAQRLAAAREEILAWKEYDYIIVNDDLKATHRAAEAVIRAGRQSRRRMELQAGRVIATFPPPS
ncbi:MAG: guanylate kinase [Acidobacteriota bacterium]